MKFGNLLRDSAGEKQELQLLFASYKQLKKRLKRLPERGVRGQVDGAGNQQADGFNQAEQGFVRALTQDIENFNDMFMNKEEDSVIQLKALEDEASAAHSTRQVQEVYKRFVDFHGELLLLVHWSILAYTGLVKILKKHRKRTGLPVQAPQLENLLSQPFCSIELTTNFVRTVEQQVEQLAQRLGEQGGASELSNSFPVRPAAAELLAAAQSELLRVRNEDASCDGEDAAASSSDEGDSLESMTAGDGSESAADGVSFSGRARGVKRSRADQQAGEGQHGREGGRACGLQAQQVMDRVSPRSAARANQQSMMQHTQAALNLWDAAERNCVHAVNNSAICGPATANFELPALTNLAHESLG